MVDDEKKLTRIILLELDTSFFLNFFLLKFLHLGTHCVTQSYARTCMSVELKKK